MRSIKILDLIKSEKLLSILINHCRKIRTSIALFKLFYNGIQVRHNGFPVIMYCTNQKLNNSDSFGKDRIFIRFWNLAKDVMNVDLRIVAIRCSWISKCRFKHHNNNNNKNILLICVSLFFINMPFTDH